MENQIADASDVILSSRECIVFERHLIVHFLQCCIKNGITCGMKTFFSLDCGIIYFSNIAPWEGNAFLAATKELCSTKHKMLMRAIPGTL